MRIQSNALLETVARRTVRALAAASLVVAAGCGDSPTNVTVDPALAVRAAGQAAAVQQVVEGQSSTAAIQAPFSTATGDLESLGDVGLGADDLAAYGHAGSILSSAYRDFGSATARFGNAARVAAWKQVVRGVKPIASADSCLTETGPGGVIRTVCIASTAEPNVVRVTITRTSPLEPVVRTEQVFVVDTQGTPAQSDDDQILDYHSLVRLRDGSTIDLDMSPRVAGPIVDQSVVDVVETTRPAHGPVLQQTNTIAMNVGVVADENDDTLLDLFAAVQFRDGASAALHVQDLDPADGIANEDELTVTASFTAAASNPWLETVTSTVGVSVHDLATEDDDEVSSLARTTVFDGLTAQGGSPVATTSFVPSAPVGRGEEPCGGHFERHATFPASWQRRSLDLEIDRACDGGGTSTLDVQFADATSTHGTTTWDASGNATCNTTRRDGAVVTGTYTAAEHRLVVDTVYPEGRDPGAEHLEAQSDPIGQTADLLVTRSHVDGPTDSLVAHATGNADGTQTITGRAVDARGATDFTMEIDRRTGTVTGSSQGPQDESLSYVLAPHAEVAGWFLTFTFRDPSEDLTVVGAVLLDGDGSGCGTLTISSHGGTATVPVCFEAGGRGTITTTSGSIPF